MPSRDAISAPDAAADTACGEVEAFDAMEAIDAMLAMDAMLAIDAMDAILAMEAIELERVAIVFPFTDPFRVGPRRQPYPSA